MPYYLMFFCIGFFTKMMFFSDFFIIFRVFVVLARLAKLEFLINAYETLKNEKNEKLTIYFCACSLCIF